MNRASLILLLLPLAACTAQPGPAAVSADDILQRQYAAREPHGAMSGTEADAITGAYAAKIGSLTPAPDDSAPKADAVTGNGTMRN